jgi:hypothetical protein
MDQNPALSQGILTSAYTWALHPDYWGPLETTWVNRWDKYHHTYSHSTIVSRNQIKESSPLSPTAGEYLSQRADLLGLGA